MEYRWIKIEHHIALEGKDEILHPTAEEVFSFVTGENTEYSVENPMNAFANLHFSKIGAPAKCDVYSDDGVIIIDIYAIRKNKKCKLDVVEGHIIDHCITEKEWFYISNDVSSLEILLKNAGIKESGPISLGQYIGLLRQEFFSARQEINYNVDPNIFSEAQGRISDIPKGIQATLYKYQKTGYCWMKDMLEASHGCILGDEMGLGKTLQIITLFQSMKQEALLPVLVVAPVSLLENWRRECEKFAPKLDVFLHHGSKRTGRASELQNHDVVVISYNTAVSDLSMLKMIQWHCVVLDEAQNIKNPGSERAKSVKAITRKNGIAVTGTPFENHITDIWSLVDFSVPGLLGDIKEFTSNVSDDVLGAEKIEPILSPIMIRRLVKDVANDLPEKIIIPQPIIMSESERDKYEEFRQVAKQEANNTSVSLGVLQKLRMFCTHPALCNNEYQGDPAEYSVKYQRFCELTEEIISLREKVIVFTSYRKMFDIFYEDVPARFSIPIDSINGETPVDERQKIVDWFNNYDGAAMLVLNPRAAGTGLNITGANHVIHYNLEWNPALEDQASARAYRRGQNKTVFVYRLFYSDTVEQIVNERIERKREISAVAVVGVDGNTDQSDILRALELAPVLLEKG